MVGFRYVLPDLRFLQIRSVCQVQVLQDAFLQVAVRLRSSGMSDRQVFEFSTAVQAQVRAKQAV